MYDLTRNYPLQLAALRAAIAEHFIDRVDRYGCQDESAISEISAASYDGFIAHTNGGFRTLVYYTLGAIESEGLSDFESTTLQGYIDSNDNDAAKDWVADRGSDAMTEAWEDDLKMGAAEFVYDWYYKLENAYDERYLKNPTLPGIEVPAPWYATDAGGESEEWRDYRDEYLREGSTFFYELTAIFYEKGHRCNVTGEDELYIFAGINTDFEYGRERGLITAIERTYKLARLTPARLSAVVGHFTEQLI